MPAGIWAPIFPSRDFLSNINKRDSYWAGAQPALEGLKESSCKAKPARGGRKQRTDQGTVLPALPSDSQAGRGAGTYQHNHFGLWLLAVYQAHDGLDAPGHFFCCVFVVICPNPNNDDLQGEKKKMFAALPEQMGTGLMTLKSLHKHHLWPEGCRERQAEELSPGAGTAHCPQGRHLCQACSCR